MPLFYAIVEVTEPRCLVGSCIPATLRRNLSANPRQNDGGGGVKVTLGFADLSTKQQNATGDILSRLHPMNHLLKVVHPVMKKKGRSPNSADIQVGESIRAHRLMAGMSQSSLADRLGVSFQQIQKYEKGVNRVGAGRLPQIAKIFRIPVGALFDANAETSAGESTGTAPVKLIPDRNTLKLLTAFGDITDRGIRHSLASLVDKIARAKKASR